MGIPKPEPIGGDAGIPKPEPADKALEKELAKHEAEKHAEELKKTSR